MTDAADGSGTLKKSHQNEYEYQNGILSKSIHTDNNDRFSFYALYTHVNGNITAIKAYDLVTNQLVEEDYYYYDDKINPFFNTTHEYLGHPVASSRNNVIHSKFITSSHLPINPALSFEYNYNEKGYPVEKYIKGKAGKPYIEESYTYTY
jgi:hypothetical protein